MDYHLGMKPKWLLKVFVVEFFFLIIISYLFGVLDLTTVISLGVINVGLWFLNLWSNKQSEMKRNEREEENKQREKKEREELKVREKLEQEREKRREKLNGYIHEHNQKLIDTVIKHWYTITPHDITCRMKAIDTVIKPWYEDIFVTINESNTTEHLQTGYADIWKLRQECKTLIDGLSNDENAIKVYIKNKLKQGIPSDFEWESVLDDTEKLIYKTVEDFSKKGRIPDYYILAPQDFGIPPIHIVVDAGDKELVEVSDKFLKLVKTMIKDKILYEMFETTNKNRKLSHVKIHEFYQGLKQIEHDFEEKHIELKGTCKDCTDWQDELNSMGV